MGKIIWSKSASRWVKDIFDYVAVDKPGAAKKLVASIYQTVEMLRDFPELGQRSSKYVGREIRILLYGHYRIAYQVKKNRDIVVLGVFHGALELKKYLSVK